jgi:DNA-binding response OmpR family regulator
MDNNRLQNGQKILVVDDEIDILETLEELLEDMFTVDTAASFEQAVAYLKNSTYHVAVLDIMGVRGYDLLEATHALGIPTLMLTAHALSPDNLKKSIELGADAYIPKDKMVDIALYVEDVLSSRQNKRKTKFTWFSRLQPLFNEFFGEGWTDPEKDFWERFEQKFAEH